jgi:NRPS condensation-like uncharacterized protein
MKEVSDNRKLGQLEKAMEILNSQATTWNLVTISQIKGQVQPEILKQSLDIIQSRHPRLNSRIINFRNSFYFQTEGTEKIRLRIVNKLDCSQWEEVVIAEMNEKIDSSKCLLRVVAIYFENQPDITYLITTIHHAISDGLSSIQLHGEILTYHERIKSGKGISEINVLAALPAIEELIPKSRNWWITKMNSIFLLLKIGLLKIWKRPKTLGFEKYVDISQRQSNFIHKQLSPESTQKFIRRCREENTTVNSALYAVLLHTLARKFTWQKNQNISVNCLSYFDLRRHFKPPISPENMAVLATSIMGFHTLKIEQSIWELARKVKQGVENVSKNGDIFNMLMIVQQLIDFCFLFPREVAATVSLSNIGKINIPNIYGSLELEEISFAGSHALYAGVFVVHAATFREKMLLNFVCSQPSISSQTMEKLVNDVIEYIRKL